ncbi:hypothetical protein [Thiolapillus sp.]
MIPTAFTRPQLKLLLQRVFLLLLLLGGSLAHAIVNESEPNDTPATAQDLGSTQGLTTLSGSIDTAGDVDFFKLDSINTMWGFVAVLDTSASTSGKDATLSVYDADGATLLQQDRGAWSNGSVLAWQHFQNNDIPIYIKVASSSPGETISAYSLHIYVVSLGVMAETEPNNDWSAGNISARSHTGTISNSSDMDCYRFSGKENDQLILALRADPENDGSNTDFILSLYNESGGLLASMDHSGPGGNEYMDTTTISRAIYSYCVAARSGAGATATYAVGTLINGDTYLPGFSQSPEWLNPGLGDTAFVGDTMQFRLTLTNTSLLPIPPDIRIWVLSIPACLSFADKSNFDWTSSDSGNKIFNTALEPNHSYSVDFSLHVLNVCNDPMYQEGAFHYYAIGSSHRVNYLVADNQCEASILQILGPLYTGTGATYFSSETGIETAPASPFRVTVGADHKLILEAPWIRVRDGDELLVEHGAQLRVYGKTVSCP